MSGPYLASTPSPGGNAQSRQLQKNELIAGRYRVLRFLARGGMGEVYEVEDLELREPLALKTISQQAGGSVEAVERFKREIHLARKVTHPNVCRIFDLGQHQGVEGESFFFLTMELLRGETLAERLRQRGRLTIAEALPLVEQMAAALGAAHKAGIVHRDFKSENIFLVEHEGEKRVVVTDFGVARGGEGDRFSAQVTTTDIVGTPAYMAPEQVEGGVITPAADLYALGVVIYEMVTGKLPFEGDNPLTTAVKRLREEPRPPHVHVPDLEPRWEKVILRALARVPKDRFNSASELVEALHTRPQRPSTAPLISAATHPTTGTVPVIKPRASSRLKGLVAVLVAVMFVSAGLMLWNYLRPDARKIVPRRSIAVLGFQNVAERPEVDWISTALAEMLATELSRGESLRLIPGENVNRLRKELQLETSSSYATETLQQIRSHLGTDFVVQGSYVGVATPEGEQIRLDLRLQDAALGNTVGSYNQEGLESELFGMVAELGQQLRGDLGVGETDTPAQADPGLPTDPEAAKLFAEALDHLRDSRPLEARNLLQQAARIEPSSAMLHYSLSSAWESLGYKTKAAEEAARAFELSAQLSQEDRLMIEGRFHEAQQNWQDAITAYADLWDTFPDNVEYGLRLVETLILARQPDSALQIVEELGHLPAPHEQDPRIALAEASAAGLANRYAQQLEAANVAAERAEALGASLLVARARLTESQAQRFFGRADQAQTAAEKAFEIYDALQHPIGSAQALNARANSHFDRADFDAAVEDFRRAIDLYRQIGDQGGIASTLNNLALAFKKQGDLNSAMSRFEEAETLFREIDDELGMTNALNNQAVLLVSQDRLARARPHFEEALAVWEERRDKLGMAYALNNLAAVLHLQGELTESRDLHRRALLLRREIGHKSGETVSLTNLGSVLTDLGELDEASNLLRDGLALAQEIEDRSAIAQAFYELGDWQLMSGELEAARQSHNEALALRRELGERTLILDSSIALARLELEAEQPAAAEVAAQLALRQAVRDRQQLDEAHLRALLTLALLEQERVASATTESQEAVRLAVEGERFGAKFWIDLAALRVRAANGETKEALSELKDLQDRALRAGDVPLLFAGRIAEIGFLSRLGQTAEAQSRAEALAQEAEKQGFLLWQRKAEKLMSSWQESKTL